MERFSSKEEITREIMDTFGAEFVGEVEYDGEQSRYHFEVIQPIPGTNDSYVLKVSVDPCVDMELVMKKVYAQFRYLLQGTHLLENDPVRIESCMKVKSCVFI